MTPPDQPESGPRTWWIFPQADGRHIFEYKPPVSIGLVYVVEHSALLKAEARIAELSNGYFGRQAAKMCVALAAAESRVKELEQTLGYRDDDIPALRATIGVLRAENERLRPVVEKLAGEDGFPFGYLELLAREALK